MRISFLLTTSACVVLGLAHPAGAESVAPDPAVAPAEAGVPAASETAPAAKVEPKVEQLEKDLFRIGTLTFRPSTREIRFDAKVNMQEGLLEYCIVRENGDKAHEALLATTLKPSDLNIAMKLLRYPESPELLPLRDESGAFTTKYPDVSQDVRDGARIQISVIWKDGAEEKKVTLNEWINYAPTQQAMPIGPWLYTGSYLVDEHFAADTVGDMAAIVLDGAAMINYPGKDNGNDDVWTVFPKRVPPVGTPVTVVFTPYSQPKIKSE